MAETFCSRLALASTLPAIDMTSPEHVELKLLYDPFQPETVETHELEYEDGKWLSDYLEGLPDEAEWMVFYNGEEIDLSVASITPVSKGDRIGLIVLPQGGGGLKSVLRVVLQAAAIALAFVPGIGWAAALAINVGIGLMNAFLLTPKPPKSGGDQNDRSYGIDGAKNSATEGIPYPVVYGEYRIAGNFSDCFTQNVGDNQYLFLRTVINDGLIDSISDIEINEQPIANFKDVQHRIKLGSLTEQVNDWFPSAIRQTNKGVKLSTAYTSHITSQPVDMVRFDVAFPSGLVSISEKKGDYWNKSVTFQMDYRQVEQDQTTGNWVPVGDGSYSPLPHDEPEIDLDLDEGGFFNELLGGIAKMAIKTKFPAALAEAVVGGGSPAPAVEYRVNGGGWQTAGTSEARSARGYAFDPSNDGSIAGPTNITPYITDEFEFDVPDGDVELRTINGAILTSVTAYPRSGSSSVTVTDRRTRAIRKSFTSRRLNKGYYECRIRRTNAQSTDNYQIDECYLTDIAEIETDPVAMRGTANLSLRIKLTDQLNQIPQLTAKVKGSVVQKYDGSGLPTVKEWSNNPAWIGLDILLSEERGAVMASSRIDWPRWIAFAEYCETNNIEFNGVFETGSNIGDAVRQVLRIGHAAPVPFGTKISVAIDRKRDPVTVFTQASMIAKSFQVTYLSMQDRSNEFEVTYYDKGDRNKAKTIRYVDPKAITFNEMPRVASVSLVGVDNIAQAKTELWRMIYANRLLIRTVTFESFMESISLALGEVALIQHDQMEWAYSGRLKGGNTATVVHLDQKVEMEAGEIYSALVHFSAFKLSTAPAAVSSVVGNRVFINSGGQQLTADQLTADRLVTPDDRDYEIVKVENGATYHTITLAAAPSDLLTGDVIDLYNTDKVVEKVVSSVTQNADGTSTLNLAGSLGAAPERYANFVFGKVAKVRKPYVLTGVSGSGIEKRKLTFMEYHEGVYGPPEVEIPIPVDVVSDRNVEHVTGLLMDYERLVAADRKTSNVRVYWNAGGIRNYGGADVYMRLNGGSWGAAGSAANVTEFNLQLAPDDQVEFKVVAYSTRGDRAPFKTAPTVAATLGMTFADVDPPLNFVATPVAFDVNGTVQLNWSAPVDPTGIQGYEIQYKRLSDTQWINVGTVRAAPIDIPGIPTGTWVARIRSVSPITASTWVQDQFQVVITAGSVLANFNAGNDRNGAAIPAPSLPAASPIEHTLNTDGSANISLEWLWNGSEGTIDGFRVKVIEAAPAP